MDNLRALIRKILSESNTDSFITQCVKLLTQKYENEYGVSCDLINQGECESFAEELEDMLKEEGIKSEMLSDGLFFDPFGDENPELIEDPGKYGNKPLDFDKIGLPSHYWIYANGKHYDSDAPEGVSDMFQLPIIKNFYKKHSKQINESRDFDLSKCPIIKATQEMIDEVNKFNSAEEMLRAGGLSTEALDRAAFGFAEGDIKTLMPKQLNIKWKQDLKNAKFEQEEYGRRGMPKKDWAKKIKLHEPIDVSYDKDKFWIEDGHHRYWAAKILNLPLNINLEIKQSAMEKISPELDYDDFHRCLFKQIKNQ